MTGRLNIVMLLVFILLVNTKTRAQENYQSKADQADSLRRAGNYTASIPLYQEVLARIPLSDTVAINKYQIRIGLSYGMLGENKLARKNYLDVIQRTAHDTLNIFRAHAYNNLAMLYENEGAFAQSIKQYKKALALYDYFKNDYTRDIVRMNIGIVRKKQGLYHQALQEIIPAVEGFEARKNSSQLGEGYSLLGSIQNLLGETYKAKKYHHKSIDVRKKTNDNYGLASAYNNLGVTLLKLQELDSAAFFFNKSIQLSNTTSTKNLGSNYHNLGLIKSKQENYSEAKSYFDTALQWQSELADTAGIIEVQNEMALLEIRHGNPDNAIDLLRKNKKLLAEIPNKKLLMDYYFSNKAYYKKVKNKDSALFYIERVQEIQQEINQEGYLKEIAFLQESYEADSREKQIGTLAKDNVDKKQKLEKAKKAIAKRNKVIGIAILVVTLLGLLLYIRNLNARKKELSAKLTGIEIEKNRLAAELHDFSGTKLRSLNSDITHFIDENPKNKSYKKIQTELLKITHSIIDISHELKTPEWKNQRFSIFISDVLYDWQENKNYIIDEEIHHSELVDAIPEKMKTHVYRFILESLTNILRHSNATKIFVKTSTSNLFLNFEVLDNGTAKRNYKKGIGHINMNERAAEVQGKFAFRMTNAGGESIFSIPKPKTK